MIKNDLIVYHYIQIHNNKLSILSHDDNLSKIRRIV